MSELIDKIKNAKAELLYVSEFVGTPNERVADIERAFQPIFKHLEQPQLNDNQLIAIDNAKKSFEKGADLYDCAIDMMLYDGLEDKEWAKATLSLLFWALEQEEE